ncbi:hypothetical protein AHAS_Ahas19G0140200 [Arachis hypogaea]
MEEIFVPFRGIKNDLQGRFMGYKQDWIGGLNAGFRCFFLQFQIFHLENNWKEIQVHESPSYVSIDFLTDLIYGGQPLLILGVAEPTVIMCTFMFNFAKSRPDLGSLLFLAWSGWYRLLTL